MGEKEWDPADLFDVFGDHLARQILVLASEQPVSAQDLATELNVSEPTIYRRVNALADYDLLAEQQQLDSEGNHYRTVETTLQKLELEIEDGGYNINLQVRQSLTDRFDSFWAELDGSRQAGPGSVEDYANGQPHKGGGGNG